MNTSPVKESLPELPEPAHRGPAATGDYFNAYTADQLREYGRLCVLQAIAAPREGWQPLTDEQLIEMAKPLAQYEMTAGDVALFLPQWRKFARAIEAHHAIPAAPLAVEATEK